MLKYIGYTVITIIAAFLTFFGMGPVLFADGSLKERLITLSVVILCYAVLGAILVFWRKKFKK